MTKHITYKIHEIIPHKCIQPKYYQYLMTDYSAKSITNP
jgi:hypothetical protein